jgi:hypothetical protein
MSTTAPSRSLIRLSLAALVSLALVFTGCSSDDGDDDAASNDTTEQPSGNGGGDGGGDGAAGESEWCAAVRAGLNVTPAEQLSSLEAQREAAPDDLKDEYDALIDLVQHQDENPTDAVGIAERQDAVVEPMRTLVQTAQEDCDITINLGL